MRFSKFFIEFILENLSGTHSCYRATQILFLLKNTSIHITWVHWYFDSRSGNKIRAEWESNKSRENFSYFPEKHIFANQNFYANSGGMKNFRSFTLILQRGIKKSSLKVRKTFKRKRTRSDGGPKSLGPGRGRIEVGQLDRDYVALGGPPTSGVGLGLSLYFPHSQRLISLSDKLNCRGSVAQREVG